MKKFLVIVATFAGSVLFTVAVLFLVWTYIIPAFSTENGNNYLIVESSLPSAPAFSIRPTYSPSPVAVTPKTEKSVECVNCESTSNVEVSVEEAKAKIIGKVTANYKYSPAPFMVNNGRDTEPNELVLAILKKQELGHLSYEAGIPGVMYSIGGTEVSPGVFELKPQDVTLSQDYTIDVDFSIQYPVLSENQFKFVRVKSDYRFVYGLIKGVVEHEQKHYKTMESYISEISSILDKPIAETQTIKAADKNEFRKKAGDIVSSKVSEKLKAARDNHEVAQDNIDAARPSITFRFENEVDGEVPPEITAQFMGEGKFEFKLPAGEIPRPPKPQVN